MLPYVPKMNGRIKIHSYPSKICLKYLYDNLLYFMTVNYNANDVYMLFLRLFVLLPVLETSLGNMWKGGTSLIYFIFYF